MGDDFVRIGEVLDPLGVRMGLGRSRDAGLIWSRWSEIVGVPVAEHAEPSSLREGVLRVRADSPAWAGELGYLAEDIKLRANELIGRSAVNEVRVWTGRGVVKPRPERRTASDPTTGRSERSPAEDPTEALERAREAWRRRRSKGGSEPP